jgi:hypothetical protein
MNDLCFWNEHEAMACQEHFLGPFDVFGNGRLAKWMLAPDRSADARAHVVERAQLEAALR